MRLRKAACLSLSSDRAVSGDFGDAADAAAVPALAATGAGPTSLPPALDVLNLYEELQRL